MPLDVGTPLLTGAQLAPPFVLLKMAPLPPEKLLPA
jgi:hypothetical protein